jgi:hypothetical protein
VTSKAALSRGWSLAGNHHGAMCGSLVAIASWSLSIQGNSPLTPMLRGVPWYRTRTVNRVPAFSGRPGVTTSSCRLGFVQLAGWPSTETAVGVSTRSRSNRLRFSVARAVTSVQPRSPPVRSR